MRTTYHKYQPHRKYWVTNFHITAPQLRVIDSEGKQIGLLSREEAMRIAQEKELDVVLIAEKAVPPVAKIIDFKKFLYQEEKKLKEARKGIKKSIVKDVKLSLFIGPADFDRLVLRSKNFLSSGSQVRVNLTLKGREMGKKDMAFELIKKYIALLGDINISKEPRIEGRVIRAVVAKKK